MNSTRNVGAGGGSCGLLLMGGTPTTRRALHALLDGRASPVLLGEAADTRDLVEQAVRVAPDLILFDTHLPDVPFVLACREVRERAPSSAIALLTTHADARSVVALAIAGAVGHVSKTLDGDALAASLLAIHRPQGSVRASIGEALLDWFEAWSARAAPGVRSTQVSRRDLPLLRLLISGVSDREIAAHVGLDPITLRSEIARVYLALSEEPAFRTTGASLARLLA